MHQQNCGIQKEEALNDEDLEHSLYEILGWTLTNNFPSTRVSMISNFFPNFNKNYLISGPKTDSEF